MHGLLFCCLGLASSACGDDEVTAPAADGGSDTTTAKPTTKTSATRAAESGSGSAEPAQVMDAGQPAATPKKKSTPAQKTTKRASENPAVLDAGKAAQAEADAGDLDEDAGAKLPGLVPQLIQFDPMYSAHDGVHSFQFTPSVPRAASNAADGVDPASLKWTFDSDFLHAEVFPGLPGGIQFTTKRPGQTKIEVTAKTRGGTAVRGEATVTISAVTASEWDVGFQRFFVGRPVTWGPSCKSPDDTGSCGLSCKTMMELPPSSACGSCHTNRSSAPYALEYTPTQTARYSNEELADIFLAGKRGEVSMFDSTFLQQASEPSCVFAMLHTWEMSDEETRGVIAQLRAFPPKANAAIDKTRLTLP